MQLIKASVFPSTLAVVKRLSKTVIPFVVAASENKVLLPTGHPEVTSSPLFISPTEWAFFISLYQERRKQAAVMAALSKPARTPAYIHFSKQKTPTIKERGEAVVWEWKRVYWVTWTLPWVCLVLAYHTHNPKFTALSAVVCFMISSFKMQFLLCATRRQLWVDLCPTTCWRSQGFVCKVTTRGTTTSSTGCVQGHQRTWRRNYTWTLQTVSGSAGGVVIFLKEKEQRI